MTVDRIAVGGFTVPVALSQPKEITPQAEILPNALIGQRVQITRQPAPNSFGVPHPVQILTGIIHSARKINRRDWTLVVDNSYVAYGPDGGYFTNWSIAPLTKSPTRADPASDETGSGR